MKNVAIVMSVALMLVIACNRQPAKNMEEPQQKPQRVKVNYEERGEEIAQMAQMQLFREVSRAIDQRGTAKAVRFCNLNAIPLTDSLGEELGAGISRISLHPRNPGNAPATDMDQEQLNIYAKLFKEKEALRAELHRDSDKVVYYKPIRIQMETCLKCHGKPGRDIDPGTMSALEELYPDDKATGFSMGGLRGAWKIVFDQEDD